MTARKGKRVKPILVSIFKGSMIASPIVIVICLVGGLVIAIFAGVLGGNVKPEHYPSAEAFRSAVRADYEPEKMGSYYPENYVIPGDYGRLSLPQREGKNLTKNRLSKTKILKMSPDEQVETVELVGSKGAKHWHVERGAIGPLIAKEIADQQTLERDYKKQPFLTNLAALLGKLTGILCFVFAIEVLVYVGVHCITKIGKVLSKK
ncbi:hypothetical protein [Furfurilactobacillus entadae]|uniref:hypothetical protein n=1 Tax=Furfurilactobacillus entadae TaxID=2922307 RepID=UPI0035ED8684